MSYNYTGSPVGSLGSILLLKIDFYLAGRKVYVGLFCIALAFSFFPYVLPTLCMLFFFVLSTSEI